MNERRMNRRRDAAYGDSADTTRRPAPRLPTLKTGPDIVERRTVARSRLFRVDEVELAFSNGERRVFEQLVAGGEGGIVVVPVTAEGELILVEEYALGIGAYELGFVKGVIDPGETAHEAAARELREETGFAAGELLLLDTVTLMPAYSNFRSSLFIASDLEPAPLPGDEPEPLVQHRWPLARIAELHGDRRITDARTRLALYLVEARLVDRD